MSTIFENQGGWYEAQGDYILPCVALPNEKELHIGIWGERRRKFLKAHHRIIYYNLLTSGTLNEHLADVNNQAETMFSTIVKSLAEKENIT